MKLRGIVHGIQREMRQVNIMKYESLSKIYYVSPDNYMKEYTSRFMFPYSMHLGIRIRQYNRKHEVKSTNDIEGVRSTRKRNKRNHRWRSTEIGPAGKHRQ